METADVVQVMVFIMLAAAVVLASVACIGETMRLKEAHEDTELRVAALENELLRLRVPKVVADDAAASGDSRQLLATKRQPGGTRAGGRDGRIHYEIGRDGAREKRA